jgi:hypothetical protein
MMIYAAQGQIGFQTMTGYNYFPENTKGETVHPVNSLHYSVGPSYWFRLKNRRIEFNPAISFDYSKSDYESNSLGNLSLEEKSFVLSLPILIYPLDFNNDCNCPTFNKGGQFFEKGFHFMIYTAMPYTSRKITGTNSAETKSTAGFQLGLGAGIDIGLSRKWTLSPSIVLSKFFQDSYTLGIDDGLLLENGDSRYRLDLMLRFIWFAKKKR